MGFIIWYKVEFRESQPSGGVLSQVASALPIGTSLPLKVSNDVFSGKYILDAEITLTMLGGATADSLKMTLLNLPVDAADTLRSKQIEGASQKQPLLVDIYLGYFDDDSSKNVAKPVMTAAVTFIRNTVNESGLLETEVRGQELGGYKLRNKCNISIHREQLTADDIVKEILGTDKTGDEKTGVKIASNSHLVTQPPSFNNYTLTAHNALEALRQFANFLSVPLVVRDNNLFIGPSVGVESAPPFDQDTNIVRLDQKQDSDEGDNVCQQSVNGQIQSTPAVSYEMVVLGNPDLRVGQKVSLILNKPVSEELRINQLEHTFSTKSGYTCKVMVVVAKPGQIAPNLVGAHGVVGRIRDVVEGTQSQKPAIDIGQIKEYEAGNQQKHLATLDYGQSPGADVIAPSVETSVDQKTQLHSKPISSPFAWQQCGLMVPVYPGMRALLAHNRGLVNDAVVAGFLWSEQPTYERPKNEAGDYWLCLPTEIDTANHKPKGKGVNDLTDKGGLRVIQAKGLHIFVGNDKLPNVGDRPDLPDAQTIVIEHESGTKITIGSDGALKIEAAQGKEISLTNGGVTLTLGKTGVEVK